MRLKELQLTNFRNYRDLKLNIENMINIFYGNNAQGKTNILESIFFGAFGISHRTSQENNLIYFDDDKMVVCLNFEKFENIHQIRVKKCIDDVHKRKEVIIDNVKTPLKEFYGYLKTVMFSPEDLQIVKGEPSLRRRYIDMQISQTNRHYLYLLSKYNKLLSQRNRLLKEIREGEVHEKILAPWDAEFINLATEICIIRIPAIEKIKRIARKINYQLTESEELDISYVMKNCHEEDNLKAEEIKKYFTVGIAECRNADISRGITNIGPHRDDIIIKINGKEVKDFCSQGQQRTAALVFKLSEIQYIYDETGEYPVLLLDDVMSELDEKRRKQILNFIDGKIQTFITVNDRNMIPNLSGAAYYEINNGKISKT